MCWVADLQKESPPYGMEPCLTQHPNDLCIEVSYLLHVGDIWVGVCPAMRGCVEGERGTGGGGRERGTQGGGQGAGGGGRGRGAVRGRQGEGGRGRG